MLLAYGFLRKIFEVFEKYKTSIDMITTSEVAVSVTIDDSTHLQQVIKELEPLGTIEIDTDQTIISIVGNEITRSTDILKKIFNSINTIPVRMVSYGGSPHNVSLLISSNDKKKALKSINYGVFGL
jgi:aspartate kinase